MAAGHRTAPPATVAVGAVIRLVGEAAEGIRVEAVVEEEGIPLVVAITKVVRKSRLLNWQCS